MASIDRGYILSLLTQAKTGEDGRLAFYQTQPYPAMRIIAEDRVQSLRLLIGAVENGLLERLAEGQAVLVADDTSACCVAAETFEHDEDCESRLAASDPDTEQPTVSDMRAIFGEPVEGRDYDVMPGGES